MPRRILIVEDDSSIAQTLLLMLRTLPDVEVERAFDGEEGLKMWLENPADILLTDNHMRGLTGLELVKILRTEHHATQPMLMITAYDSTNLQREAREVGIDELIPKPFFFDQLLDKVQEFLNKLTVPS